MVKGIKSFDGNYYILTNEKISECVPLVLKQIKTETTFDNILSATQLSKELCRAVIEILKDDGEIIEKEKNVFRKV